MEATTSLQAKGKAERPFRWLQDRIVCIWLYEGLWTRDEVRAALHAEVHRYNEHQVHSTTGEIPNVRFERARREGNSLFRKFALPQSHTSPEDVFCLRQQLILNTYRRISLLKHIIDVPNAPPPEYVDVHLVPGQAGQAMRTRIWWANSLVHTRALSFQGFCLHL